MALRLSWGGVDYQPPEEEALAARAILLETIQEHVPEVLENLRQLLPLVGDPALDEALRGWAAAHHLPEWVLPTAKATLLVWSAGASQKAWCHAFDVYVTGDGCEEHPFEFSAPGWRPWGLLEPGEAWEEYERRLDAAYAAAKAAYRRRMEALAEERGLRRTPVKRNRSGDPLLHFKWLAEYQVRGRDYEELSQEYTDADPTGDRVIGSDAIRKAVADTARLVGLTLR